MPNTPSTSQLTLSLFDSTALSGGLTVDAPKGGAGQDPMGMAAAGRKLRSPTRSAPPSRPQHRDQRVGFIRLREHVHAVLTPPARGDDIGDRRRDDHRDVRVSPPHVHHEVRACHAERHVEVGHKSSEIPRVQLQQVDGFQAVARGHHPEPRILQPSRGSSSG